jgi:hypothetical protein
MNWRGNVIAGFIAGLLIMAGLYQLEIIYINVTNGQWFDLPFYIIRHPDCQVYSECYYRWMAFWRDVFYTFIIVGAFILGLSMYKPLKTLKTKIIKK